ncbi:hypothetical protein AB2B41_20835 [Marimonas sp. MJW-29]|uniref:Uncharacterized protein n=1 Tax=Sulfitobacter sediminis TaxID=3234186 RepID=A0ABV3RUP9_9RHOB
MANMRHKPEEKAQKPRQFDVLVRQGMMRVVAIREVRITDTGRKSTLLTASKPDQPLPPGNVDETFGSFDLFFCSNRKVASAPKFTIARYNPLPEYDLDPGRRGLASSSELDRLCNPEQVGVGYAADRC